MMVEWIRDWLVPAAMFALMFGMGLTLRPDDFRRIAAKPTATLVGTVLQLVGMPLVAVGLAFAFELPPLLAAGLVVAGACPGGMFSNMYVHFARANTALSITLTASATMVTLFTLPVWTNWMLASTGSAIEMPILSTALELGALTVLPIGIGMWVRLRWPEWLWLESKLAPVAALVIVGSMALDAGQRPDLPTAEAQLSAVPSMLLALAAVVLGLVVPSLARLPMRDTVTIAVELVVKNALLGFVIVSRSLEFEAFVPIGLFAAAQTPAGILVLVTWRWLGRRGWVEPPPPKDAPVVFEN